MNTAYQREDTKQAIEWFNSLSQEEKIKEYQWVAGRYIQIACKGWPFTHCSLGYYTSHYFTDQNPAPGTPCNCRGFTYRKDGYCQRVIEEEYNPLAYA